MKILVFCQTFLTPNMTFIYNEVKQLAQNHTVKILCCNRDNEDKFPFDDVMQVNYLQNPITKKYRWIKEQKDQKIDRKNRNFKQQIKQIISDYKPDLIHCHFGYEALVFIDNFQGKYIPCVVSFHGYDASQMLEKKAYVSRLKQLIEQANYYPVYVSKFMKNSLEQKGINMTDGLLLHYGTDTSFFKRENYFHDRGGYLFFSRFPLFMRRKVTIIRYMLSKIFLRHLGSPHNHH